MVKTRRLRGRSGIKLKSNKRGRGNAYELPFLIKTMLV